MKITKLTTYRLAPRWMFLKVDTDEGISGWGEPVIEGRARSVEAAVHELSEYLIGQDPARITSVSDWLSGLLIGHEVAQMQQHYSLSREHGPLVLVGSPALTQRYLPALKMAGIQAQVIEGDAAFQAGIRSIVNELEN